MVPLGSIPPPPPPNLPFLSQVPLESMSQAASMVGMAMPGQKNGSIGQILNGAMGGQQKPQGSGYIDPNQSGMCLEVHDEYSDLDFRNKFNVPNNIAANPAMA